jgi:hypothetical protein
VDERDASDEGRGGPVDESTATVEVPRADGEGEEVLHQQPVGRGQVLGHGEFPGDQPPRGPEEVVEG